MNKTEKEQKFKKRIRDSCKDNTYFSCGCKNQLWEGITLYLCNDHLDLLIGKKNGCLDNYINGEKACHDNWCEAQFWCKFHPDYKEEEK